MSREEVKTVPLEALDNLLKPDKDSRLYGFIPEEHLKSIK